MEITKEKFDAFIEVRNGGQTNMLDTIMVSHLADNVISSDEAKYIISNFDELAKKYGAER